jgi:hypothetical protein
MDELPEFSVREPTRTVAAMAELRDEYLRDVRAAFKSGVRLSYLKSPDRADNEAVVAYAGRVRL